MRATRARRQGMALLTVLLLVAVMSAVAVAVLDDVRFSVRRTTNAETQVQAQWYADGAEILARQYIGRLTAQDRNRTPLEPAWNGRANELQLEAGRMTMVVSDGQACFNLNSVVTWTGDRFTVRELGEAQMIRLGQALGIDGARMRTIVDSLIDWMDTDAVTRPQGGEDGAYAGLAQPYRTAGVLLAEVSELRAVRGVDDATYQRLRPHLCALPSDRSPININGLRVNDAPLIQSLLERDTSLPRARSAIAARPTAGWKDPGDFWSQPALAGLGPAPGARDQVTVRTEYFKVRIDVEYGGTHAVRTALIEARAGRDPRTLIRRWTVEE